MRDLTGLQIYATHEDRMNTMAVQGQRTINELKMWIPSRMKSCLE